MDTLEITNYLSCLTLDTHGFGNIFFLHFGGESRGTKSKNAILEPLK
jgi:hypothetical protein